MRFSAVGAMLAAMFLLAGSVSAEQTQEGLTSRNTRSLRVLLGWYPEADVNGDGVLTTAELDAYRRAPQYVNKWIYNLPRRRDRAMFGGA